MRFLCVVVYLVCSVGLTVVDSLPGGAPSCQIGSPAVQSLHLAQSRSPLTGDISSDGFQVFIDGQQLTAGSVAQVQIGRDLVVKISSSTEALFKGALVLLSKADKDYSKALSVSSDKFQLAPNCEGEFIAGITHVDRSFKKEFEATLRLEENAKKVYLDVNIVMQNNVTRSISHYSRFEIESVGAAEPGTCGLFGLFACPKKCGWLGAFLGLCAP